MARLQLRGERGSGWPRTFWESDDNRSRNCWDSFNWVINSYIENSPPLPLVYVVLNPKRSLVTRQSFKSTLSEVRGEPGKHLCDLVHVFIQGNGEICARFVFVSTLHDSSTKLACACGYHYWWSEFSEFGGTLEARNDLGGHAPIKITREDWYVFQLKVVTSASRLTTYCTAKQRLWWKP